MGDQEKYKQFSKYNFDEDAEFKRYIANLSYDFSSPVLSAVEAKLLLKYKKKFYKQNIDADFDVNYEDPSEAAKFASSNSSSNSSNTSSASSGSANNNTNTSSSNTSNTSSSSRANNSQRTSSANTGATIEGTPASVAKAFFTTRNGIYTILHSLILVLAFVSALGSILAPRAALVQQTYRQALIVSMVVFFVEFVRVNGGLSFSLFSKLLQDVNGQYFLLTSLFLSNQAISTVLMVNIFIISLFCFTMNVNHVLSATATNYLNLISPYTSKVLAYAPQSLLLMAYNEFALGISQILFLFTADRSIMLTFFVLNFLSVRYIQSRELQLVFSTVRQKLDVYLENPNCPQLLTNIWRKLKSALSGYITNMITQAQQAQAQAQAGAAPQQ